MNEYTAARTVLRPLTSLLHDVNDVARVPLAERYTYAYDQHAQEIDHIFVSEAVAARGGEVEHVHVNTWARSVTQRASDHDPTVVRLWVCDAESESLDGEFVLCYRRQVWVPTDIFLQLQGMLHWSRTPSNRFWT